MKANQEIALKNLEQAVANFESVKAESQKTFQLSSAFMNTYDNPYKNQAAKAVLSVQDAINSVYAAAAECFNTGCSVRTVVRRLKEFGGIEHEAGMITMRFGGPARSMLIDGIWR